MHRLLITYSIITLVLSGVLAMALQQPFEMMIVPAEKQDPTEDTYNISCKGDFCCGEWIIGVKCWKPEWFQEQATAHE